MSLPSDRMRVLVTGGAGFIGSHLTDALLAHGADVTVVDDLSTGRAGRLHAKATLRKANITDKDAIDTVFAQTRPQVVCHLAAQMDVRVSVADPATDASVNVVGTVNVLQAAHKVGARMLFASTGGALYGMVADIPSPEHVLPEPESPYGTAKYSSEQYIGMFNRLYGTAHSVLRLGNVYGPRQDPTGEAGVVAILCGCALEGRPPTVFGDGTQTRDYVYVGDVVDAFIAALRSERSGTWNVGTAIETSVLDLIALIGRTTGRHLTPRFAPNRPGELHRSALDNARIVDDLGWQPTTQLSEGISKVHAWIEDGYPDQAHA